ncbi:hypothetical protein P4B35_04095 [Pontiellaceae bacterium B12227]|nr:hypothetical protein [Pontiellaceae bacterium B12227]
MKRLASEKVMHRVLTYEGLAFAFLISVTWLNERFHFPSLIWGAEKKVFEWQEALFETSLIILAAVFVMSITHRLMRRLDQLEGILPICSSCKNIKNEQGQWQQVEQYVHQHTHADFSHGLCPDCAREYSKEAGIAFDTQLALNT